MNTVILSPHWRKRRPGYWTRQGEDECGYFRLEVQREGRSEWMVSFRARGRVERSEIVRTFGEAKALAVAWTIDAPAGHRRISDEADRRRNGRSNSPRNWWVCHCGKASRSWDQAAWHAAVVHGTRCLCGCGRTYPRTDAGAHAYLADHEEGS